MNKKMKNPIMMMIKMTMMRMKTIMKMMMMTMKKMRNQMDVVIMIQNRKSGSYTGAVEKVTMRNNAFKSLLHHLTDSTTHL